jgi:hypothetical protein
VHTFFVINAVEANAVEANAVEANAVEARAIGARRLAPPAIPRGRVGATCTDASRRCLTSAGRVIKVVGIEPGGVNTVTNITGDRQQRLHLFG